ncbi:enoyl-CoA hydratase/isomerase family protein [Flexivirga caeni]|uniref:Enoyl-CoA hydratase n=1 Tax=Flexivirga caeni TaxID=2294115 RepID=A0A3M9M329_9MICO|nr:enoyl-CoA hydratase-related protein [Flexivirga caeni]RNI19545.1 enoyl-CoA hydratase [Flexivirga caeni]
MSETSTAPVVTERAGGVAIVRLNRPDAMNSLNLETKGALLTVLRKVAADDAVRCVVLTGTGRAFCVGQDLKEHVGLLADGADALFTTVPEHYNPIVTLLSTMDKPVVAAVNGVAAGAGAAFAFAADFRILADTAGFNLAFTGIALSSDSGSSFWLPRLVGVAKAKELLLMPRTVRADEAQALGLATRVVPADEFADAVSEFATSLAAGPTKAYGAIRRAVEFSATHTLAESLEHEAGLMALTGGTRDHHAAVDAFLAKEQPVFEGR